MKHELFRQKESAQQTLKACESECLNTLLEIERQEKNFAFGGEHKIELLRKLQDKIRLERAKEKEALNEYIYLSECLENHRPSGNYAHTKHPQIESEGDAQ